MFTNINLKFQIDNFSSALFSYQRSITDKCQEPFKRLCTKLVLKVIQHLNDSFVKGGLKLHPVRDQYL